MLFDFVFVYSINVSLFEVQLAIDAACDLSWFSLSYGYC